MGTTGAPTHRCGLTVRRVEQATRQTRTEERRGRCENAGHALAPVAELPVVEVVSAVHILADLTLGLGKVVHDYMS